MTATATSPARQPPGGVSSCLFGVAVWGISEKIGGFDAKRLGGFVNRKQSCILATALDHTNIGPVHTHALRHRLLAQTRYQTKITHIRAEQFTDIHP
jgi:hypothetical protein